MRAAVLAACAALALPLALAAPAARAQPAAARPRLTKAPRLVRFVEAPYPATEKAAGKAAAVLLQLAIGADGAVTEVQVVESAGAAFDAAAAEAARQFRFDPAEIDGKPAPVKLVYRYEFVLKVEKRTTAIFRGTVRDRRDKKPLAGVTIALGTGQKVVTGADGRFVVDEVQPGIHEVSISGDGVTAQQTEETFAADKLLEATYLVSPREPAQAGGEADDFEVVVVAPPLAKQVVSTEVPAEQGKRVPGTQGDVLKVVENLPGVARSTAGSGQLVVWGAAPQDTRVYVDGVRVPLLYHNGGLRSILHSDLVRSVELVPGGYGAAYGRGLGGLVTVRTRPLDGDGVHGAAALDLLDASALVRAPIGESWHVVAAFRRGHLDAVLPLFTSRDVGDLFPIPRYYDGQVKVRYDLSPRESVEMGAMLSNDRLNRTVASSDPAAVKREGRSTAFWRVFSRYERKLDDGGEVSLVPSYGVDDSDLTSRFGQTPTELSSTSRVFGLRGAWRGRAASYLSFTAGLDVEAVSSDLRRSGSVTSPAREGDIRVFGQARSDALATDSWSTTIGSAAPFAEADFSLLEGRLHVLTGARFEPYLMSSSRRTPAEGDTPSIGLLREDTAIEPRFALRYQMADRVSVRAAYGLYHQAPSPEDLSPVFGNPSLGISSATQWLSGISVGLTAKLTLETTVFYVHSRDLAVRSPLAAPLLAQALSQEGSGRAFGGQTLLRQELAAGFFAWLSYSYSRSERTNRKNGPYRLFDYDQTHVLTAVASYDIGRGFEIGARVRLSSGFPRTPVAGSYFDARLDQQSPLYGPQNGERIPAFFQADLRASRRFKPTESSEVEVYLDVQNVTSRANPEEIVYSSDYRQKRYITGLPLLPVAGARVSW
jgi:TonB family protein